MQTDVQEYVQTLSELKKQIAQPQLKAAIVANKELIKIYWLIGKTIVDKKSSHGWGAQVIEKLAKDLQSAFPGMGGFSRANLFYMQSFYLSYEIVQQPVGQFGELPIFSISWGHNVLLITKLRDHGQRLWYAQKTVELE